VGATFYLEPAATLDIDVFVTLPTVPGISLLSLSRIYDYLGARGYSVEREYVVIGNWPVQLLAADGELEQEAVMQARETEVEGVKTKVMTGEHLVALALRTGRAKDHARLCSSWSRIPWTGISSTESLLATPSPKNGSSSNADFSGALMSKQKMREYLASLSFSAKIKILEQLRDRSLAIAASRKKLQSNRSEVPKPEREVGS
jgi:hypothetical protein